MLEQEQKLITYIERLIEKNYSKKKIQEQLLAVGWSENQIDSAYSKTLINQGIPVPSKAMQSTFGKTSSTAEIAINFCSFILLAVIATALGTLFYQIINKYFPDNLMISSYYYNNNRVSTSAIHYSIAALIVGFPLYWLSIKMWFNSFKNDPGKIETKLTKWLTYLVLLITSMTIIGDVITTIYNFLQGELNARFVLKSLTILLIAGLIFSFYFFERKEIQYRNSAPKNFFKFIGIFSVILVLLGVILGFMVSGSPSTERKRGFDNQRERDLQSLSNCIENYSQKTKLVPESLEVLKNSNFSYCANSTDPETQQPYFYKKISQTKLDITRTQYVFELCANFSLASEENLTQTKNSYYSQNSNTKWSTHKAGKDCDQVTVVIVNK